MSLEIATRALRLRSAKVLRGELGRTVAGYDGRDDRDLMMALAPLHDCARRIGLDPAEEFDAVARTATPPELAALLRHFGRRDDITPHAFGFELTREDDGPAYAWSRS